MKEPVDTNITIDRIAQESGVSTTTVSRFLNGKYEYMSAETKARIDLVISRLHYKPNALARSLRSKRSRTIGMVVADITNSFSSVIVKSVWDVCAETGYQLMVANTNNNPKTEHNAINAMLAAQVEGIVVNTTGDNDSFLVQVDHSKVPIVLADRILMDKGINCKALDTVTIDNIRVTEAAVKRLFMRAQRVAFFTTPIANSTARRLRHQSFLSTSALFGSDGAALTYTVENSAQTCEPQLRSFMEMYPDEKKAAFIVNGNTLRRFLRAMRLLNLRAPEDILISSFDEDLGHAQLFGGEMDILLQPSYEMGKRCAQILFGRINNTLGTEEKLYEELACEMIFHHS